MELLKYDWSDLSFDVKYKTHTRFIRLSTKKSNLIAVICIKTHFSIDHMLKQIFFSIYLNKVCY